MLISELKKNIASEVMLVAKDYLEEWKERLNSNSILLNEQLTRGITLSAIIICKNEEDHIENCIRSIDGYEFDEIIVVDTGSIDHTKSIIESCMDNIKHIKLFDFKWCDNFSAARNFGLKNAEGDWVFFIDADETLKVQNRRSIKEMLVDYSLLCGNKVGVSPVIINSNNERLYNNPRIFCKKSGYRYYGNVHEMLRKSKSVYKFIPYICLNIEVTHLGYEFKKNRSKIERNLNLIELNIVEEPENPLWYCYKLRDGKYIYDNDEKMEMFNRIKAICSSNLRISFYLFCYDWALVMIIIDLLDYNNVEQAKIYLTILKQVGACTENDIQYLSNLIEFKSIELNLEIMRNNCSELRNEKSIKSSLINTSGYHYDELIMKIFEMQHKMIDYMEYKNFLFESGYFFRST